jgi:hypothetical protein
MVMRFDDNTAVLNLRVWSRAEVFWDMRWDLARQVRQALPDEQFSLPLRTPKLYIVQAPGDVLWRFSAYRLRAPMKGMPLQTNPELRERFVIAAQHQPNQHFPGRVPATRADAYSLYLTSNLVEDDQWLVGGLPVVG